MSIPWADWLRLYNLYFLLLAIAVWNEAWPDTGWQIVLDMKQDVSHVTCHVSPGYNDIQGKAEEDSGCEKNTPSLSVRGLERWYRNWL